MTRSRRFVEIFRADITKILRDRMTLALMLTQAVVVMALLGITFSEGVRDIPIVVVQKYHDPLSEKIVSAITGTDQFQVVAYLGSEEEARKYIDSGRVQGAIVIDSDLTEALLTGKEAKVKILVDGSQPMVQYTFRALGSALTTEIQKQVYQGILEEISNAVSELEQYSFLGDSAQPLVEDVELTGSRVYGAYQATGTGVPVTAGKFTLLPSALDYAHQYGVAINQKLSATSQLLIGSASAVGSVASGYLKTADHIEPIGDYLIQKGTATGDLNLIQMGYTLKYIAQNLRTAYAEFESAGLDEKLRSAGIGLGSAKLSYPSEYAAVGVTATAPPAPRMDPERVKEMLRSIGEAVNKMKLSLIDTKGGFSVNYDVMYNGDKLRILDLIAPILLALFVAMGTLATTAPMVVKEKERGVLERISTTPIPPVEYILSKILAALAVTTVQVIVLILVGIFAFRLYIGGGIWMLLLILFPVALSHIGMGILISTRAKSEREAVQAIPAIIVPSIILSGVVFPISMLPAYIRPISYLIPLTYCQNILLGVMVKGAAFTTFLPDLIALFVFATLFLVGGVYAFVKSTRQ